MTLIQSRKQVLWKRPDLNACLFGFLSGWIIAVATGLPLRWLLVLILAIVMVAGFQLIRWKKRFSLGLLAFFLPIFMTKKFWYSEWLLNPGGPAALGIFLYDIPLLFLAGQWIWRNVLRRELKVVTPRLAVPFFLFALWSGISIVNAQDITLAAIEFFWLIKIGLMIVFLFNVIGDSQELRWVVGGLIIGLGLQVLITFLQAYLKVWFSFTGDVERTLLETTSAPGTFRAGGTVGLHNVQAGYYAMLIPFCAIFYFLGRNKWRRFLLWGTVMAALTAMLLTYSRNGYVSVIAGLVVMIVLAYRRRLLGPRLLWLLTWATVSIAVLVFPILGRRVLERVKSTEAFELRMETIGIAGRMIGHHPFLGIGLNNFALSMNDKEYSPLGFSDLQRTYIGDNFFGIAVHNKYLLIASQSGLPGLIFFLAAFWLGLREAWRLSRISDPLFMCLGIGLLAALCGAGVNMLFDIFNSELLVTIFWVLATLAFCGRRLALESRQTHRLTSV